MIHFGVVTETPLHHTPPSSIIFLELHDAERSVPYVRSVYLLSFSGLAFLRPSRVSAEAGGISVAPDRG